MEQMNQEPNAFRVIACPHILSIEKDRLDLQRPAGGTVTDLLHSIGWTRDGLSARVSIDGHVLPHAAWEYTVPHAGQSVVVRAVPKGGGQGKDALRIVAMISIMVAAIATQQYWAMPLLGMSAGTVGALGVAAASIVGTLAVTALVPPPLPRRGVAWLS